MRNFYWLWPAIILLAAVGAGLVALIDSEWPLRPVLIFSFLLICPGMALVPLLRLADWVTELCLAVGVSIALDMLVAAVLVYSGIWSPSATLMLLIAVSLVGATVQIVVRPEPAVR